MKFFFPSFFFIYSTFFLVLTLCSGAVFSGDFLFNILRGKLCWLFVWKFFTTYSIFLNYTRFVGKSLIFIKFRWFWPDLYHLTYSFFVMKFFEHNPELHFRCLLKSMFLLVSLRGILVLIFVCLPDSQHSQDANQILIFAIKGIPADHDTWICYLIPAFIHFLLSYVATIPDSGVDYYMFSYRKRHQIIHQGRR